MAQTIASESGAATSGRIRFRATNRQGASVAGGWSASSRAAGTPELRGRAGVEGGQWDSYCEVRIRCRLNFLMALSISIEDTRPGTTTVALDGRLDNESASALDQRLEQLWKSSVGVLVFDLKRLIYISSLGIRSLFRAQKEMRQRQGESLFLDPQPAVRKVFDIVMAVDLASVFASTEELDAYLDSMQRRVQGQTDP